MVLKILANLKKLSLPGFDPDTCQSNLLTFSYLNQGVANGKHSVTLQWLMWHEGISNVATQGHPSNLARWVKIMQNHQGKLGHCVLYEKQFLQT